MSWLSRIMSPFAKALEGATRSGPYYLPITGGWLSAEAGQNINWWQNGYDVEASWRSAMVEACVSAYAQTVAMCPGDHWRATDDNGRERVAGSALARILRSPNEYQTISDFQLNAVSDLYSTGNAYALGLRNNRFEINELHLMDPRSSAPTVAETGDVFYALSGNAVIEARFGSQVMVPARDVLHIKLKSARYNHLVGESPLMAAAGDIAMSGAITTQQMQFYRNQARPGIILSTDLPLKRDQVNELRAIWKEQTSGANAGGTPILSNGLKPILVQTTAKDAEVAEVFKMTQQNIALAFRMPLQILGIGGAGTSGSTVTLMQEWVSSSLGFALNHVEEAFGKSFGLFGQPDEYVEFSTAALLRSNYKDRIEALARGVISGIYSPNEARAQLELPEVEFGDEPRVQQQVVPLSAAEGIPSAPGPGAAPPAPPALPAPDIPPGDAQPEAKVLEFPDDPARIRRRFQSSHARHSI